LDAPVVKTSSRRPLDDILKAHLLVSGEVQQEIRGRPLDETTARQLSPLVVVTFSRCADAATRSSSAPDHSAGFDPPGIVQPALSSLAWGVVRDASAAVAARNAAALRKNPCGERSGLAPDVEVSLERDGDCSSACRQDDRSPRQERDQYGSAGLVR
jgi:hypothetical protein